MKKDKLQKMLITGEKSIKEAMQQIGKASAGILFIVDENQKLLGTVTDGDIRRGLLRGLQFDDDVMEVAFRNFDAVLKGTPNLMDTVRRTIRETKNEQIPIVDEKGRIVDVILLIDIMEAKDSEPAIQKKKNKVVIMAGGAGTRLDPFTKILPKPLIPVGNRPVIDVIMNNFERHGFHKFIYTLNYKKEYIKLYLAEKSRTEIEWIEEGQFLGTAGSLALLKGRFEEAFFVANCDSLMNVDFTEILEWHNKQKAAITIIGCHREYEIPFGVLELANGKLEKIREKPVHDMIINTGVYVLEPEVIDFIPDNKALDMNELIETVSKSKKISVYTVYDGWFDIGQWKEYRENVVKIDGSTEFA